MNTPTKSQQKVSMSQHAESQHAEFCWLFLTFTDSLQNLLTFADFFFSLIFFTVILKASRPHFSNIWSYRKYFLPMWARVTGLCVWRLLVFLFVRDFKPISALTGPSSRVSALQMQKRFWWRQYVHAQGRPAVSIQENIWPLCSKSGYGNVRMYSLG